MRTIYRPILGEDKKNAPRVKRGVQEDLVSHSRSIHSSQAARCIATLAGVGR